MTVVSASGHCALPSLVVSTAMDFKDDELDFDHLYGTPIRNEDEDFPVKFPDIPDDPSILPHNDSSAYTLQQSHADLIAAAMQPQHQQASQQSALSGLDVFCHNSHRQQQQHGHLNSAASHPGASMPVVDNYLTMAHPGAFGSEQQSQLSLEEILRNGVPSSSVASASTMNYSSNSNQMAAAGGAGGHYAHLGPGLQLVMPGPDGGIPGYQSGIFPQGNCRPRLRWTNELHVKFVEIVDTMGGPEKATPSAILKQMKVDGLVLSHVKSHLQKYRGELKKLKDQEAKRAETGRRSKKLKEEDQGESSEPGPKSDMSGAKDSEAAGPSVVRASGDSEAKNTSIPGEVLAKVKPSKRSELQQAMTMQLELQRQLQEQLEAQKKLQRHLEQHTNYITGLMNKPRDDEDDGDESP